MSHPTWVCGLKLLLSVSYISFPPSHPTWVCGLKHIIFMGTPFQILVTPYVGVWIETKRERYHLRSEGSHPTWVCGLKHGCLWKEAEIRGSHPTWVCGLKQEPCIREGPSFESHPTWVCGLKHPRPVRTAV